MLKSFIESRLNNVFLLRFICMNKIAIVFGAQNVGTAAFLKAFSSTE